MDKMGMVINCRRAHCCVVTDLVKESAAEQFGIEKGDVVIAINNVKPAKWLNGVSEQLRTAARPCVIELIRFGTVDNMSSSKEVQEALLPWKKEDGVGVENIDLGLNNNNTMNPIAISKNTKKRGNSTPKKSDARKASKTPTKKTKTPVKRKTNKKTATSTKKKGRKGSL